MSGTRFDRGVRRDAVARVAAGESASAVARDVGCRHETVSRWCREVGVVLVRGRRGGSFEADRARRAQVVLAVLGGTGRGDGPLDAPLTPRRALRTRTCSFNRHSRVRSARLDEEGAGRDRRGPRRRSRSGTSSVTRWERLNERRAPPLPLYYALFSSLRLCTLCCTGKSSVAEGERA